MRATPESGQVGAGGNRYAVLLRGINVGGHRGIRMADLRLLLEDLGYRDVVTYLQSGQAALTAADQDERAVQERVAAALAERFGTPVDVLVAGHAYLRSVIDQCPFPTADIEGKQLHAAFMDRRIDPAPLDRIESAAFAPERCALGDRVLYLWLPGGIGRSALAQAVLRRTIVGRDTVVTVRNWNTVTRLAQLTA